MLLAALSASFAGCGRTDLDSEFDIGSYGGFEFEPGGAGQNGGAAATGGHAWAGGSPATGGAYYASGGYRASGGYWMGTGGKASGGAMPTGGRTMTGGTKSTGGSTYTKVTGGSTSGGAMPTGGSPIVGGYRPTGGSTPIGGARPTGGTPGTGLGGTSAIAGFGGIGGRTPVGGTTATGGLTAVGGASAMGGNTVTGGTTATGGSSATGGLSSTGGTSACPDYLLANEELIDDMDDGTAVIPTMNGRRGAWSDSLIDSSGATMVPDPSKPFFVTDTKDVCRKYAVYVYGQTSVDSGAGANFGFSLGSPYDASLYTGLSFWAKIDEGTDGPLRVDLPDGDTDPRGAMCSTNLSDTANLCWSHFGYRLVLTATWTQYTIPFSKLSQDPWGYQASKFDPSRLYSVTFAIGDTDTFGIWIDEVAFLY